MTTTTTKLLPRLSACSTTVLADPSACALFLDMDGTLLDLAPTPKSVRLPDGLTGLLDRLNDIFDGAVAIITGRLIAEADQILSPLRLAASGVHGAELRRAPNGEIERASPVLPSDVVRALYDIAERYPGVIAEPKGPGLALHYRLAPQVQPELYAALARYLGERGSGSLNLIAGKRLYEIVPAGFSKGTALTYMMSQLPAFRGRRPIMIGDDIGDEPAFAAAEDLNGFGLRVGGEHYPDSDADFTGPKAVVAWLDHVSRRLAPISERRVAAESRHQQG